MQNTHIKNHFIRKKHRHVGQGGFLPAGPGCGVCHLPPVAASALTEGARRRGESRAYRLAPPPAAARTSARGPRHRGVAARRRRRRVGNGAARQLGGGRRNLCRTPGGCHLCQRTARLHRRRAAVPRPAHLGKRSSCCRGSRSGYRSGRSSASASSPPGTHRRRAARPLPPLACTTPRRPRQVSHTSFTPTFSRRVATHFPPRITAHVFSQFHEQASPRAS